MFRKVYAGAIAGLLAIATILGAAPPDVPVALTVKTGQVVRIVAKGDPAKIGTLANFKDDDALFEELAAKGDPKTPQKRFMFQSMKPGVYVLGFFTVGETEGIATTITVVDPAPTPTPAPPKPVDPQPAADAPIPAAGLHVLIVYDAAQLSNLTAAQQGALFSKDVRDYLRATCPKGPDGATAEWRMWPADVDASGESVLWQTAFKRPRVSLPWIVVSNGTSGFEGPLPGSATDMLALLKKYGSK